MVGAPLEVLPAPSMKTRAVAIGWLILLGLSVVGLVLELLPANHSSTVVRAAVLVVLVLLGGGAAASLKRPAGLVVDAQGFTMTQLWTRKRWEFADCGTFGTVKAPGSIRSRLVAWDVPKAPKKKTGVLPVSFGLKPDDLAAVLNKHRERALQPGSR